MNTLNYSFKYIENCNLCGYDSSQFKVLGKRLNKSQGKKPKSKVGITTTIVKCRNCGLVFSNPMPIPSSIQDHYGVPPESYWKDSYFKVDDAYFLGQINEFRSLTHHKDSMYALDIGAGIGKCMKALERGGFDAYGIEPSEPFYERAINKMGISLDKLQLCAIEDANFEKDFFDFITFGAVLEHLYNPSDSITKALTWLKPGGLIHIEVPSADWLINKLINVYFKVIGTDYVGNISPMHEPFHLHEFSLKSFQLHSNTYSYEIADYRYDVCASYMPKLIDLFLRPFMQFTNTGMQLTVWLKKGAIA